MGKPHDSAVFSSLSLSPLATHSFLNASFYRVYSSFWSLIPFSFPAWPVSALDGLLWIKFCFFLSPFRMGLTNLSPALGRFLLLSVSPKLTTQSRFRPFPQTYFSWPPSLLCSLDSIFSFIIGALAWFFQITFSSLRCFARICSWLCTFLSFHQQSSCFSAFFRQLFSLC